MQGLAGIRTRTGPLRVKDTLNKGASGASRIVFDGNCGFGWDLVENRTSAAFERETDGT